MRAAERLAVRQRFAFRCAYCGISEAESGAELTVDHFQPTSRGGADVADNWVLCCHACNEFKGNYWRPTAQRRILHPLRDDLTAHLREREDGTLEALTSTGAFHIARLHLNRPALVSHRRDRRSLESSRQVQAALLRRLVAMEEQVQSLADRIERLERGESTNEDGDTVQVDAGREGQLVFRAVANAEPVAA